MAGEREGESKPGGGSMAFFSSDGVTTEAPNVVGWLEDMVVVVSEGVVVVNVADEYSRSCFGRW